MPETAETAENRTEIVQRVRPRRRGLQIEVAYEECIGLPNYGSTRLTMTARLTLSPEDAQPERAGEVAIQMRDMADSMRSRVQIKNNETYATSLKRALAFEDLREQLEREHAAARQAAGAERDQQRAAEAEQLRTTGQRPAANQNGPRMVEGDYNAATGEVAYRAQLPPPPAGGSANGTPQASNGAPPPGNYQGTNGAPPPGNGYAPPPAGGNGAGPPAGGAVQWGQKGMPRTGRTLAGALKNQPKEVVDRVRRLMLVAGETSQGWTRQGDDGKMRPVLWIDLNDGQVSWLVSALSGPESRSHTNGRRDGYG